MSPPELKWWKQIILQSIQIHEGEFNRFAWVSVPPAVGVLLGLGNSLYLSRPQMEIAIPFEHAALVLDNSPAQHRGLSSPPSDLGRRGPGCDLHQDRRVTIDLSSAHRQRIMSRARAAPFFLERRARRAL